MVKMDDKAMLEEEEGEQDLAREQLRGVILVLGMVPVDDVEGWHIVIEGEEKAIYVGMVELLERNGGSSHHYDTLNLPY